MANETSFDDLLRAAILRVLQNNPGGTQRQVDKDISAIAAQDIPRQISIWGSLPNGIGIPIKK